MPSTMQPSFAGGELAPSLYGRVDIEKYAVGLRTCLNFFIQAHGGAANRPGLDFIGRVKDTSAKTRLIPFSFSTTQTYALEFGNLYMRVIKEDGHVLEPSVNITGATQANPVVVTANAHGYSNGDEVYIDDVVGMTELNGFRFIVANVAANTFELQGIDGTGYTAYVSGGTVSRIFTLTTPYTTADIPTLKFAQSADVMTLVHPSYAPRELSRTDHHVWSLDIIDFKPSITHPTSVSISGTAGSTTLRYRVVAVKDETFEQSLPGTSTSKAITGATQADPVVITANAHGYANGDEVLIDGIVGMTELNGRRFKIDNVAANTFELKDEDGTGYTAYVSGGTADLTFGIQASLNPHTSNPVTITWTEVSGAQKYDIYYNDENNGIYGFVGSANGTSFTHDNVVPVLTDTPPAHRNPFFGAGNYPSCVTYFEQRRVFAATNNNPQKFWMTQTGNFNNMNVSDPLKADDAITFTLNSREVNRVRHLIPSEDLIIFTSGGEWIASSGQEAFTATTMRVRKRSKMGSSEVPPLEETKNILFIQDKGKTVRDLSIETGNIVTNDLSILANHLFLENEITEWSFAQIPFSIFWAIRDDGTLLGLTYIKQQQVWGWHRHTTDGDFESVCTISEGNEDVTYVIVKRTINGTVERFVEKMHSRLLSYVEDAFFVDSGLSYNIPVNISGATQANPVVVTATAHGFSNGDEVRITHVEGMTEINQKYYLVANVTANTFELQDEDSNDIDGTGYTAYISGGEVRKTVTTISGLDHLEGETVSILADGNVHPQKTVTNGEFTLNRGYSEIHAGLPYISELALLDLAVPPGGSPIQGKKKKVSEVIFKFEKSRGGFVGHTDSAPEIFTEFKQRTDEDYGTPIALITGTRRIFVDPLWDDSGSIAIRQTDPLPINILSITKELDVED